MGYLQPGVEGSSGGSRGTREGPLQESGSRQAGRRWWKGVERALLGCLSALSALSEVLCLGKEGGGAGGPEAGAGGAPGWGVPEDGGFCCFNLDTHTSDINTQASYWTHTDRKSVV